MNCWTLLDDCHLWPHSADVTPEFFWWQPETESEEIRVSRTLKGHLDKKTQSDIHQEVLGCTGTLQTGLYLHTEHHPVQNLTSEHCSQVQTKSWFSCPTLASDRRLAGCFGSESSGPTQEAEGGTEATSSYWETQTGPRTANRPAITVIHIRWKTVDEGRGPGKVIGHTGCIRTQRDGAEDSWKHSRTRKWIRFKTEKMIHQSPKTGQIQQRSSSWGPRTPSGPEAVYWGSSIKFNQLLIWFLFKTVAHGDQCTSKTNTLNQTKRTVPMEVRG